MKLNAIIPTTNPYSKNYFTFLATVNSWSYFVNEITIVDGGTTDKSFEIMEYNHNCKITIVKDKNAYWNLKEEFSPNQVNDMFNIGIKHSSQFDWSFLVLADYVIDNFNREAVERFLNLNSDVYWVKYQRYKLEINSKSNNYFRTNDTRGSIVINNKKIKKLNQYPYMMGIYKKTKFIYDYPIRAQYFCGLTFREDNKIIIPMGDKLEGGFFVLPGLTVFVADHFFYSFKQLLEQRLKFNEYFDSRPLGIAKYKIKEAKLFTYNEKKRVLKKNLLNFPYPDEFKRIIQIYYKDDMRGGCENIKNKFFSRFYYRLERLLITKFLRLLGLQGLFQKINWQIHFKDLKFNDVNKIYKNQNRFY